MKKVLFVVLSLLLFIPTVFAKDLIEIKSVELDSKSEDALEKSEPKFNGLDIDYDIAFAKIDDFVKYKIIIKNNSDEDYKLVNKESFGEHDFIKYSYESEETLKANDTMEVIVTITYNNQVNPGSYVMGKYNESNKVVLEFVTLEGEKVNPKTSTGLVMFIAFMGALIIFIITMLLFKRHIKGSLIILLLIVIIPLVVNAVTKLVINVNVKVEIERRFKVIYNYNYNGYYTQSEVDNNSQLDCTASNHNYYLGSISPENKIYLCSLEGTYEDPKTYLVGDEVTVDKIPYETILCSETLTCTNGWNDCICPGELTEQTGYIDNFMYSQDGQNVWSNDYTTMNFRERIFADRWNTRGYIQFNDGTLFTMPSHDVYIYKMFEY